MHSRDNANSGCNYIVRVDRNRAEFKVNKQTSKHYSLTHRHLPLLISLIFTKLTPRTYYVSRHRMVPSVCNEARITRVNNNNNNRISIAPYGRNFRGAGGRSDQCSVKAWLNRTVLSLDLKTDRKSSMRTVCGSEFQTVCAENRKARLEKSVLINGLSSSGMVAERKKFGCKRVLRFGGVDRPEWTCSELCMVRTANLYIQFKNWSNKVPF